MPAATIATTSSGSSAIPTAASAYSSAVVTPGIPSLPSVTRRPARCIARIGFARSSPGPKPGAGIGSVALVTPQLGTGKLRPIVQTGEKRVPALKDVPTVMESVPELSAYTWLGVFAPVGTPKPIVERFNKELAAAIREERVSKTLIESQLMTLVMSNPDELRKFSTDQGKLWGPVVKENDIKGEM